MLFSRLSTALAALTVFPTALAAHPAALAKAGGEDEECLSKAHERHTSEEVLKALNLKPLPEEGGYHRETFRDSLLWDNRTASTAIFFMINSTTGWTAWHQLDVAEVWHFYAGAPIKLAISDNNGSPTDTRHMGGNIFCGQEPQAVVEAGKWQRARTTGSWSLVGTTGENECPITRDHLMNADKNMASGSGI
ncbi:RmlC-like jelly roll fold protein [Metarhizium rileyi]|uniref:RmlC-like jelly roll fold protein n=1 Tax=Metarhizium rileyi (strain RCEF 4871) TaxID=1649241 RepID=A0A167A887_METRR|nr:RmlC-like jelly roll fold protein [Metarhizium rileyi RCEF 4871]